LDLRIFTKNIQGPRHEFAFQSLNLELGKSADSADFESTRGATMVGAEGAEDFWKFDSSRLFFNFEEGLFTLKHL